jgi:hypothetical protein
MLSALILVCSLTSVHDLASCTEHNATAVIRDPEAFVSPITCYMHGQAYLADTALGRDLGVNDVVKVVCAHGHNLAGTSAASSGAAMLER